MPRVAAQSRTAIAAPPSALAGAGSAQATATVPKLLFFHLDTPGLRNRLFASQGGDGSEEYAPFFVRTDTLEHITEKYVRGGGVFVVVGARSGRCRERPIAVWCGYICARY